jgi:hypothetical protein
MTAGFVGITVFPEYFQTEGVERVLDNLVQRAGATAIATSPYVMEPADPESGTREPPIDAGAGKVRLLDRPLWGRRELYVRTAPSFTPRRESYRGLRYQPPVPDALTARGGATIERAIRAAKARGLAVYLQVQAAIPPGYRVQFGGAADDDRPLLPDGGTPAPRVDNNGSLASPHILAYGQALLIDLARAYPAIDGFHIDWPEYPPYTLDAAFLDFGPHAVARAAALGLDIAAMRADAQRLRTRLLGGLAHDDLAWLTLERIAADYPGFAALGAFKARLAADLVAGLRRALDAARLADKALVLRTFPPPWTVASGVDFARLAPHCQGLAVKLFTMHWPMMVRMWADSLAAANPGLADDPALPQAVARLFDVVDDDRPRARTDWRYPEPEEPHPVGAGAQARKIAAARAAAAGAPVAAMAHGYGPLGDFAARFRVAWGASDGRVWVNRYGYLADAKLDAIGRIARGAAAAQ